MKNRTLFLCIALYLLTASSWGSEYEVRRLSNADGLSNSSVNVIFQDRLTRMWFGTWDGLDCYDGLGFRILLPSPDAPGSMANNIIRDMVESPDGAVWVATDRGIDCYNPGTGRFRRFFSDTLRGSIISENSFHLVLSPDGMVTAVVDGHGIFRFESGSFRRIGDLGGVRVQRAAMDRSSRLWLLMEDGRLLCDGVLRAAGIHYLYYDRAGDHIWLQDGDRWSQLDGDRSIPFPMGTVRACGSDSEYHYLGTASGLWRVRLADGSCTCLLEGVPVLSVLCGTQQIIWVGTDMQGVWQLSQRPFDFGAVTGFSGSSAVRCFAGLPAGALAVGTKGAGLFIFQSDGTRRHLTVKDGLLDNAVYSMEDDGDVVWIGSDGNGLNYLDKHTHAVHTLSTPDSLRLTSVYALQTTGRDTFWVGTSGNGLYRLTMERQGGRIKVVSSQHYPRRLLGSDIVYSLLPEGSHALYIGTRGGGLVRLDWESGAVSQMPTGVADDVLSLMRDGTGCLWCGTSMGLFRFGPGAGPVRYAEAEGLPGNTVHGILQDRDGVVWVSTNNGLARLDVPTGRIVTYSASDGLQDNEFSDGAYYSDGGLFYFGGINGFNLFDPLTVGQTSYEPVLVLDEVRIDNGRTALPERLRPVKGRQTLVLGPEEHSVSFRFVPIDFLSGGRCEMAYRLDGFNLDWVSLGKSNTVVFSNLPAGDYILRVRCSNADRVWSEDSYTLPLRVLPPWWKTSAARWAYTCSALLLMAGAVLLVRNRIRFRRRMAQEQADRQKTEEIHEAKLDFFTSIAHEFSNSLTLIYGPCEELRQSARMTGRERQYLQAIASNADRMGRLIQQLINFRKAETGHLTIRIGRVDVVALVMQETDYFREQMEQDRIGFSLEVPEGGVVWTADGDSMEKIVFNLFSNAVKYTPEGGTVRVRLAPLAEWLEMDFTNTGVGIPEERRVTLFDRYEVLDRFERALSKGKTSNGIGLALCKSLVELHHGHIAVWSDGTTFTTFHVELPRLPVEDAGPVFSGSNLHPEELLLSEDTAPLETSASTVRSSVLVVDDDSQVREFLRDILQPRFDVLEAGDGAEALRILGDQGPQVVVSDLMMPVMDGAGLLRAMRSDERMRHIPFILLSAKGTVDSQIEALENGADAYVAKPFHPRHLLARIDRLLGRDAEVIAYSRSAQSSVEQFAGREMKKSDRAFLTSVTEVILGNLDNEALSVGMVAAAVSVSPMQLYRKLKDLVGQTPTGYIRKIRLDHAEHLLKTSSKTVQEIMYACGFVSKTYFYREFSKRFGMTPGEYRRRA